MNQSIRKPFTVAFVPAKGESIRIPSKNKRVFAGTELYVHKIGGKKEAKFHSCYGLRYRSSSNYNILLYAGGEYHIKKSFTIGSIVSFGGYSGFNHGFYFRHQSKKFISAIGTNNLIGLFWNQSNATGINLSLSYIIE